MGFPSVAPTGNIRLPRRIARGECGYEVGRSIHQCEKASLTASSVTCAFRTHTSRLRTPPRTGTKKVRTDIDPTALFGAGGESLAYVGPYVTLCQPRVQASAGNVPTAAHLWPAHVGATKRTGQHLHDVRRQSRAGSPLQRRIRFCPPLGHAKSPASDLGRVLPHGGTAAAFAVL